MNKKFTRDNFLAFMAEESVADEDSTMISSHGMAELVLERFERWLNKPETVGNLIVLPVRQVGLEVYDAEGMEVMVCKSKVLAAALVAQLNPNYLPDDDEEDLDLSEDEEDEDES